MEIYNYLERKLIQYRGLINIITIILLLLLPLPYEKVTLLFFMLLFIALFQLVFCIDPNNFSSIWPLAFTALLAVFYIIISVYVVLNSFYIIKRRLSLKMDIIFSIFISIAGLYSLDATINHPDTFSVVMVTLFFVFNTLRCFLQFRKSRLNADKENQIGQQSTNN